MSPEDRLRSALDHAPAHPGSVCTVLQSDLAKLLAAHSALRESYTERGEVIAQLTAPVTGPTYDLVDHVRRQAAWSLETFGPGSRTPGVLKHIRKELDEIALAPGDIEEWIDVIVLAIDGATREGATPEQVAATLAYKLEKNTRRQWPDWRTVPADQPIEHVRAFDGPLAPQLGENDSFVTVTKFDPARVDTAGMTPVADGGAR